MLPQSVRETLVLGMTRAMKRQLLLLKVQHQAAALRRPLAPMPMATMTRIMT